jgi:hypothetical protein
MQLTQRINQTQLQEKDPDAENLLGRELGANSDAVYIMAQTVLVQNMALENLKAQVAQLQQAHQPAHTTSFLGRLLGEKDEPQQAPPPPPRQYQAAPPPAQQGGWQPVPQYQQAPPLQYQAPPPQYAGVPFAAAPMGQPSFFRGAMQTAAGVAAGALAFEGVESLLHGGFGHGGGWGGGPGMAGFGMGPGTGFGGGFQRPVEETVVNNYYDQPGSMGGGDHRVEHDYGAGGGGSDFSGGEHHFQNTDGSGAVYSDADYTTQGTDAAGADQSAGAYDQGAYDNGMENDTVAADNSVDNVQIDDSGSGFDGGGGGFDSGGDNGGGFDGGGGDSGF